MEKLNKIAGKNGIGRVDLVENRFLGIKSRGVYETPGGTLLIHAHRAIESVTLDKNTMHKKDSIMSRYAELIYNGYWFSKERFKLQKIVDLKRNKVNGTVKLKLYKGNIIIQSRITKSKAYSMKKVSFEEKIKRLVLNYCLSLSLLTDQFLFRDQLLVAYHIPKLL